LEEAWRDAGLNEDVDRIHQINAAIADRDLETVAQGMHPDIVWEHNLGTGSPEEGTYEGRETVMRLFERLLEPWEYIRLDPREVSPLGAGLYLVKGEVHFKHRATEAEVVTSYEQRMELRDGLLVKGRMTTGQTA
jgi:ketosteroid isomerase-like protein